MAEPLGPEVYLAIAASLNGVVNNYRNKKRTGKDENLAVFSADSSKSSLNLTIDELLLSSGLKVGNDGYVQWAMDSPAHPKNWSSRRKAYDLGLILFLEFFMSAISAGGTPASFYGSGVLGHSREVGLLGFSTMYLLGQALGVLLFAPYSSKFERRTLYIASAFLYSVFCLPVAATSNIAGVFVGRFVTGLISAIPAITTRHSIEDLFHAEGRMWVFFSWALLTNLGLVLGPLFASYVAVSLNWRWIFYLATIIVAVTGMLMYFIRKSHTAQLLEHKVAAIQSQRGDLILRTAPTAHRPSIFRPVMFLFTNPTVCVSSLTNAFSTALLYLFAVAFPLIYADFAWSRQKTTLIFLFIALGLFVSTLTRIHDRHASRKHRLANRRLAPEKSLLGLAIGAPALAVGLWWFAWTIPGAHVHGITWPASAISLVPLGYGVNEFSTVLPRYVIESQNSPDDAASAFAAMLFARAILSAVFPLFTQRMFESLGHNSAGSVLAAVATACCVWPTIILFNRGAKPSAEGSSSSGSGPHGDGCDESGRVEKKRKPKKTVRWDDETDVDVEDGSRTMETKHPTATTLTENDSIASSDISTAETVVPERTDPASSDGVSEVPVKGSDAGVGTSGGGGGGGGGKEEETKKQKKKKENDKMGADEDTGDDLAAFLGMDLERLAVFPYF